MDDLINERLNKCVQYIIDKHSLNLDRWNISFIAKNIQHGIYCNDFDTYFKNLL